MFETESLLSVDEDVSIILNNPFRKYCEKIVDYTQVEAFYIFEVCNLVTSHD